MTDSFDLKVFHAINGMAAPGLHTTMDHIMAFIAQYALEMYAVLFVIAWFALPKTDIKRRHGLVIAGFAGILALIFNYLISHFIWYRDRPFVKMPHDVYKIIPHAADASFPSDHSSGSAAFAFGSWGNARIISWIFTLFALLTMFARVYVGVHYPTDVLASLVVGLVASLILRKFSRLFLPLTLLLCRIFKFGPRTYKNEDASE